MPECAFPGCSASIPPQQPVCVAHWELLTEQEQLELCQAKAMIESGLSRRQAREERDEVLWKAKRRLMKEE